MSIGKIIEKLGPETDLDSKTLWHWISREVEWALQTILISKRGKMKKTSFQHNISLRNLVFPKKEKNIDANCILILKNLEKLAKVTRNAGYSLAPTNESIFLGNSFFLKQVAKAWPSFHEAASSVQPLLHSQEWFSLLYTTHLHSQQWSPVYKSGYLQKIGGSTDVYWS